MVNGAADERRVPAWDQAAGVALTEREDVGPRGEQLDQDQREEEVWDGLEEHQAGQHPVEPAAVPPASDDAKSGANEERDHRGGADQGEGPGNGLAEQRGDRCRVLAHVGAEIEREYVAQVGHVLMPQRTGMANAEQGLQRMIGRRLQVRELRHDGLHRATRHRPGEKEVHGQRDPGGDGVERQAPEDV